MWCVIHYTPDLPESDRLARRCLESFQAYSGWQPELRAGITPLTMTPEPRLDFFLGNKPPESQPTKIACFQNHLRFWRQVVESGTPGVFLEHDVLCVGNPPNNLSGEVIHLAYQTAQHKTHRNDGRTQIAKTYVAKNHYHRAVTLAGQGGTCAYWVSPSGAEKLLAAYHKHGAEQSDLIINSHNVDIQILEPSVFELDLHSISTSHGF